MLHGEDRLYLTCGDPAQTHNYNNTNGGGGGGADPHVPHPHAQPQPQDGSPLHSPPGHNAALSQGLSTLLGHKHWHVIQVRALLLWRRWVHNTRPTSLSEGRHREGQTLIVVGQSTGGVD